MGLTVVSESSPVEKKWGFVFGIEGALNIEDAMKFLGGCSRSTVDRLAEKGLIRTSKIGRRVVYCKRSLREFMKSGEV